VRGQDSARASLTPAPTCDKKRVFKMDLPDVFQAAMPKVAFKAGSLIFSEGEPGSVMYVIKEGEVELTVRGKSFETISEGDFFGEMALVEQSVRSATAVARTDCKLAPINEREFLFMVRETPFFSLRIMRTMSSRLRRIDRLI
jgi:CRP/FNR family cyclic AMP-dependent transcriptional regulator